MNTFRGKLVAGMVTSLVAFAAQASTGSEAVRKAQDILGTQTHQGETTDGQRCELSFQNGGGVLLGDTTLGGYAFTVGGQLVQEYDFIPESTVAENGNNTTFDTVQHEDGDDSPDEGGFHRGFTTTEKLEVTHADGSMTVKIVNGTALTCRFAE
jgi:hypothetical protein